MKLKLNNLYYSSMAVLLPLLGFQSCDGVFNQKCEYGSPTADYKFKGDVTTEDAVPVKGIKVVVIRKYDSETHRIDSTLRIQMAIRMADHLPQILLKTIT